MSISITRQTINTCGCCFEYSWDTTTSNNNRVHTPVRVVSTCPAHAALANNPVAHYNTVTDEGRRWNQFITIAQAAVPLITWDNVNWSFNVSRTLVISFVNIAVSQNLKNQMQQAADTTFGVGKVLVQ